jgi:nuclear pore complex protein Nup155
MGLMSLIKRAWVTIDSTIYLWNYENGYSSLSTDYLVKYLYRSDLAYFDGLNEIILSVGLVLPKVGVFKDHIHYLLVLTTPTEIIILGVSFVGNFNNGYY